MIEPRPDGGPLLLIADDDDDILHLMSFRFERSGYEVVTAQNGEDALRLALELRPRLAVLDAMMPGLDGFEVTRRLREDERTCEMPVILVTALAQASDVSRGLAAGADDYVKKPFDANDLKARVERLLAR